MSEVSIQLPPMTPPTLTRITESKVAGGEMSKLQGTQDTSAPKAEVAPQATQVHQNGSVAEDALKQAVEALQKRLDAAAQHKFVLVVDKDTGRSIVEIRDSDTGKVIRQFPPEEILNLAKNMRENNGLLLKTSV